MARPDFPAGKSGFRRFSLHYGRTRPKSTTFAPGLNPWLAARARRRVAGSKAAARSVHAGETGEGPALPRHCHHSRWRLDGRHEARRARAEHRHQPGQERPRLYQHRLCPGDQRQACLAAEPARLQDGGPLAAGQCREVSSRSGPHRRDRWLSGRPPRVDGRPARCGSWARPEGAIRQVLLQGNHCPRRRWGLRRFQGASGRRRRCRWRLP